MIIPQPIQCHKCGVIVISDANNLTNCVIQEPGIHCPGCGTLVIAATTTIC